MADRRRKEIELHGQIISVKSVAAWQGFFVQVFLDSVQNLR